jgi:hypothetical protein
MTKESPIFSKTYDFIAWLIPLTVKFPRQQRFVLAAVLQKDALRFQELLVEAAHSEKMGEHLNQADIELDKLRLHLRLARDLAYISEGQYEHAARQFVEIGKLLGGWKKSVATRGIP